MSKNIKADGLEMIFFIVSKLTFFSQDVVIMSSLISKQNQVRNFYIKMVTL